ncbi:MAG: aromatic hydrocarbon degradation protein [Bacteroidales bacterium]|nr:aromatic hydrocarbon degradation protein [Bacteroidales bacterium]
MKKLLTIFAGTLITGCVIAGGLVTNTNQSVRYTRLQSRNGSTAIDAVYYNPAGVAKLGNGIFISINNQTIGQKPTVLNNYANLTGSPKEYAGKVRAPIFPGIYAAVNLGNFSISAGVNPVGGGGGAKYEDGLPSFEMPLSDLVPLLQSQNIPTTQYSADVFFEGKSIYFGYQANLGSKRNDMLSGAAGLRIVSAKNSYNGYLNDIMVNPNFPAFGAQYNGSMVLAKDFFTAGATFFTGLPPQATGAATQLQPIIDAGYGGVLLANGGTVGMSSAAIQGIQGLLSAKGLTTAQIGAATISTAQGELNTAGPVYLAKAAAMTVYANSTQNVAVDVEETGMGYSPILSANFSPMENLNIGIKYEFKTKLELSTKVFENKTGGGVFTDGEKVIADMPAMLAAGVEFRPIDRLMVTGSANYYFDKDVDYDGSATENINMIDKNFTEVALGAELGLTNNVRVSAGWLGTFAGVNEEYQNDQRFDLNTNSFGGGIGCRITPMIDINLGGQYTFYKEGTRNFEHMLGTIPVPVRETYNKNAWVVAVGVDLHFGK